VASSDTSVFSPSHDQAAFPDHTLRQVLLVVWTRRARLYSGLFVSSADRVTGGLDVGRDEVPAGVVRAALIARCTLWAHPTARRSSG